LIAERRQQAQEKVDKALEKANELEQCLSFQVRQLSEYTDAEKIAAFDKLYKFASGVYQARRNEERTKDSNHYAYEAVMELLTPKGERNRVFWDHWNELGNLLQCWE